MEAKEPFWNFQRGSSLLFGLLQCLCLLLQYACPSFRTPSHPSPLPPGSVAYSHGAWRTGLSNHLVNPAGSVESTSSVASHLIPVPWPSSGPGCHTSCSECQTLGGCAGLSQGVGGAWALTILKAGVLGHLGQKRIGISIQEEEVMGTERTRGPTWTEKPVHSKGYGWMSRGRL